MMRRTRRTAYSLLELLIAAAVFAGIAVVGTSLLAATASVQRTEASHYELTRAAGGRMRQITDDLARAGNYIQADSAGKWVAMQLSSPGAYGEGGTTAGYTGVTYCVGANGKLARVEQPYSAFTFNPGACLAHDGDSADYPATFVVSQSIPPTAVSQPSLQLSLTFTAPDGYAYTQRATAGYGFDGYQKSLTWSGCVDGTNGLVFDRTGLTVTRRYAYDSIGEHSDCASYPVPSPWTGTYYHLYSGLSSGSLLGCTAARLTDVNGRGTVTAYDAAGNPQTGLIGFPLTVKADDNSEWGPAIYSFTLTCLP